MRGGVHVSKSDVSMPGIVHVIHTQVLSGRPARSSTRSSQRCASIFARVIGRSPAVPFAASSSTTKCGTTTRPQHERSLRSPLGITDTSEIRVNESLLYCSGAPLTARMCIGIRNSFRIFSQHTRVRPRCSLSFGVDPKKKGPFE